MDRALILRRAVACVLAAEALAVLSGAGYLGVETVVATPADRVGSVFLTLLVVVVAAGLAAVAHGVAVGRRWARAPTVVWQIIQALVGLQVAQTATGGSAAPWQWPTAVLLIAAAIIATAGVVLAAMAEGPAGD